MYNAWMINPFLILVVAVLFFVVIAVVIISSMQKRKKEAWKGTVSDKKIEIHTRRSDEYKRKVELNYLFVKLSDGSSKKISVGRKLYDNFSVGDSIEKQTGVYDPIRA